MDSYRQWQISQLDYETNCGKNDFGTNPINLNAQRQLRCHGKFSSHVLLGSMFFLSSRVIFAGLSNRLL